jgi:hypothetical protein
MRRNIAVFLLILGGIIFLWSGLRFANSLRISSEDIIEQRKKSLTQEDGTTDYPDDNTADLLKLVRIFSFIFMLSGAGIAFKGYLLYKQSKKEKKKPLDAEFKVLVKKQNNILTSSALVFAGLFCITLFIAPPDDNPIIYFLLLLWIWGLGYTIREILFFNYNLGDVNMHLINWEYPNGDKLIVTGWGLMKKNVTKPELSTSLKFDGFKWDLDNAKDLAESLVKQEGNPLLTLLPSIEFSTTTNRVDDYIPFSFVDNINLTFVEKDKGFLIINIEKKNANAKYTLTYPLPPSKDSLKSEVDVFEQRILKKRTPVRGVYLEKSYVDQVLNEIN